MCGFAGIYYKDKNKNVSPELIKSMIDPIKHRGPDDEGIEIDQNCGLGFRRLSIIDLESGHQPLYDVNKRACVVFNGEIYNYKEIRSELVAKGYSFRTNSDTEVLLNTYLEYGENFVSKLRGMFAFCIYDKHNHKLVLGRDRFGIKPLYYYLDDTSFVFGSELKSLSRSGLIKKELNWQAVNCYFSYGYIISPLSIFKDTYKLQPGHVLVIENKQNALVAKTNRYYHFTFNEDRDTTFDSFKDRLDTALGESVKAHMVSDVPVGAFLSGGVDSNAVVSRMVEYSPYKVKTFSIGFAEKEYNEANLAKESAEIYGTEHHELYLEPSSLDIIEDIINIYDEPFSDTSAVPTYKVCQLAAQHVKVVLSGDGGDEFFCGYNSYRRYRALYPYRTLLKATSPALKLISRSMPYNMKGKRFLDNLSRNPDNFQANQLQIAEMERSQFFSKDFVKLISANDATSLKTSFLNNDPDAHYLNQMMSMDINTYLPDNILTKVDRVSMANSLEVRVPLIDHIFCELASKIPHEMKLKNDTGKFILRETVKKYVPEFIYSKPKSGFSIPESTWFRGDIRSYLGDKLIGNNLSGIINKQYIETLVGPKNPKSAITRLWPILVFENFIKSNSV